MGRMALILRLIVCPGTQNHRPPISYEKELVYELKLEVVKELEAFFILNILIAVDTFFSALVLNLSSLKSLCRYPDDEPHTTSL